MTNERFLGYAIELMDILEDFSLRDYYLSRLPNQCDDQIVRICASIMAGEDTQRTNFLSFLEKDVCTLLATFGRRMAMLGVRENSQDYLVKGLVALTYAVEKSDYHGILMTVSLFYRSTIKINQDPNQLFTTASQYAPNEYGRELILDFLNRPPEHQGIDKMGFKEINGPSGLIYQYDDRPIPDGWL